MKRYFASLVCVFILGWCGACSSSTIPDAGTQVNVEGTFKFVEAGAAPITLTAMVSGPAGNSGVVWSLSQGNTNCSPACGMLVPSAASPKTMAVYTPPTMAPMNGLATITARSLGDGRQNFAFNFQISAAIVVTITTKFNMQTAGGPVVNLSATVMNDISNAGSTAGITWTLTAGGANCSPQCGTLTVDPVPALTAHYQPPATAPTGANDSPTITAASIADPSKSDNFNFTIVAPPISVMITNKFSTQIVGGPAVMVNAVVTNDTVANAGVTWTLTSTAGPCSPNCGTLIPSPAPSFSASYTPPTVPPVGADVNPTITAASVTDPTKSDSFGFTIIVAGASFKGSYAFQLRGFDAGGAPMALSGSIVIDGMGNITAGEMDVNDNKTVTSFTGLSGNYVLDTSFSNIPRVTLNITAGANTVTLKGAISGDGTRGKVIEYDASLALNAGTLLQQDPAALTAANPAGSYVFGLDSDAGTNAATVGRIVEAGQFTLGAGGAGVTGGVADAGQAGAPGPVLFGGATPAAITAGTATSPDASGRGTLTLTINGNANNYAYYVVNAKQLNLVEIDAGGAFATVQSGSAQLQQALNGNSLNATSVVALTGTAVSGGATLPNVIVGALTVPGDGSASVNYEFNNAGAVPAGQAPTLSAGSVFTFDPTKGRGILLNTFFFGAAVYLSDTGKGYVIDISRGTDPNGNNAFSGPLIPQTAGPFSVAGDLGGNSIAVAGGTSSPALPNLDFAVTFDGVGVYSTEVDFTNAFLGVGSNGQLDNLVRQGAFTLVDSNVGFGTISFVPGIFGDFAAPQAVFGSFYLIGPNQFVAIGQGPDGTGVDPSGILIFDPQ